MADETKEWVAKFVERLGLPSVLLIALGYFGYAQVVAPMAAAYRQSIERVADEVIANDAADDQRVTELAEILGRLEKKVDELLSR